MLCENCKKNNATTYFKQTVNGQTREVFLCSECAAKLGLGDSFLNFGDFGMGFGMMPGLLSSLTHTAVRSCPTCGTSLSEVTQTGNMGCPDCYEAFRDYLRQLLPRISGNKTHKGKTPHTGQSPAEDEIPALKKKLAEAIKAEDFEQAATLRDKIRELEQKNNDETKGE